jgi:hypothetical protein
MKKVSKWMKKMLRLSKNSLHLIRSLRYKLFMVWLVFIDDFSTFATPLTKIIRKSISFKYGIEFKILK